MEVKQTKGKNNLKQYLSMLLAVIFCMMLALQVFTADVYAAEVTEPDNNETKESGDMDPENEEENAGLTAEMMTAAWDELLLELDEEQMAANSQMITAVRTNERFLRRDVYDAVAACTEAMRGQKALAARADQITVRITENMNLSEEEQLWFLEQIEEQFAAVDLAPLDTLMIRLQEIQDDENAQISPEELEESSETIEALAVQLDNVNELLDKLELLPELEQELAALLPRLSNVDTRSGSGITALAEKIQDYADSYSQFCKNIGFYFEMSEEQQVQLSADIQQLSDELKGFTSTALIDAVKQSDMLETRLDAAEKNVRKVDQRSWMFYALFAVAALNLIMVIVAIVLAASKARDKSVDLSGFAARADVEALNQQNHDLKQQLDQQEQRLEGIFPKPEQVKLEPEQPACEPETEKKQPQLQQNPEPVIEPKPIPKAESKTEKMLGHLKMHYQSVNAANSYLLMDDNGTYILYDDGTVELIDREMQMSNDASGWTESGVFYLFNPEYDGKLMDPERDALPNGFFYVEEIKQRATVRKTGNGSYVLEKKGILVMKP